MSEKLAAEPPLPDWLRPGYVPPQPTGSARSVVGKAMPGLTAGAQTGPALGGAGARPPGYAPPIVARPSQGLNTPLGVKFEQPFAAGGTLGQFRGKPFPTRTIEPTVGDAATVAAGFVPVAGPGLRAAAPALGIAAKAAPATAATLSGLGLPYFAGQGLRAAYSTGSVMRPLATYGTAAAASSAVPAVLDNVVQGARNPGQPQDAVSRLVAPQQGGALGSGMGLLSAANASLARATGLDPLAAMGGRPTTPDAPGFGDYIGRNLSNVGGTAGMLADAPAAALRSTTNALKNYGADVIRGDYFPGTARLTNQDLGKAWKGLPGAPDPSVQNYQNMEAFGPQALGGLAMAGSGAAGRKFIDDQNSAAAQRMLGSGITNNPTGAADNLVFREAMNRLRTERPELGAWADERMRTKDLMQALPVGGDRGATNLPSRLDYENAQIRFNRPGAKSFVGQSDPAIVKGKNDEFEQLVGAAKDRYAAAAPAPTIQQSYARFRPALDKAMTAGLGGAAFAGAAPVMNQFLAAGEQAGVQPQELMGAISTTAKNVGEAATDPAKLTQMAAGPPPPDLAKTIADPSMAGKLPAIGQMNKINRAVAAGEISPEEGVQSVWGQMGTGARILLGAGLGVTALSLLMNLFGGDDDEKDPEGRGGMSFFWKVAPLLGLGAAAWGLASRDDIMQPQFSRLLEGNTWSGLANDVGLGGLLER